MTSLFRKSEYNKSSYNYTIKGATFYAMPANQELQPTMADGVLYMFNAK